MTLGETAAVVGTLKGHVTVKRQDMSLKDAQSVSTPAQPPCCPLDNFWRVQDVVIHLYILTVAGAESLTEGYKVTAKIGSVNVETKKALKEGPSANIYQHLLLPARLPGASTLFLKIEKDGKEFG